MRYCLLLFLIVGCSGSPYKANHHLSELTPLGSIGRDIVGLNDRDEVVLRQKKNAIAEMASLEYEISEIARRLEISQEGLRQCRSESADPRLGNHKVPDSLPDLPVSSNRNSPEVLTLTDEKELLLVSDTYFKEEILRLRRDKSMLDSFHHNLEKMRANCMEEYGHLRVQKGLPFHRIRAQGHFVDGNWVLVQGGEQSLDDAFRLVSKEKVE